MSAEYTGRLNTLGARFICAHPLQQVANARVHGTTGEVPNVRMQLERTKLSVLPVTVTAVPPIAVARGKSVPVPIESLQHPLSVYQSLLEVA
jgi:hypothetical protein